MNKVIARLDEQLGIALRLAYAMELPYWVETVLNDHHKVKFRVTESYNIYELQKCRVCCVSCE